MSDWPNTDWLIEPPPCDEPDESADDERDNAAAAAEEDQVESEIERGDVIEQIGELTVMAERLSNLSMEARAIVSGLSSALAIPDVAARGDKLAPLGQRTLDLMTAIRKVLG